MKKNSFIWLVLWLIVGLVAVYAIFNDKSTEKKKANNMEYAEKCYDISGTRCISLEQMKYLAKEKLSSEEIDYFSQKCGLVLKEKSEKDDLSSKYGFADYSYRVRIVESGNNLVYNFDCNYNAEYINMLRSDFKSEDSSAKESWNNDNMGGLIGNIQGYQFAGLSWQMKEGHVLVQIGVEK